MNEKKEKHVAINSISQLHKLVSYGKPEHPLITLIKYDDMPPMELKNPTSVISGFYVIMIKKNMSAKLKYGQKHYDFDEGIMAMMAPGQILHIDSSDHYGVTGWLLAFHPDFIRNYPLGRNISTYGFFSYDVNEALHLSIKEEKMIERIMRNIRQEYNSSIDQFNQDVMVSQLELLLNYINRFYNRQFITRKAANNDMPTKFEGVLHKYFVGEKILQMGLPTVHYLSEQLHISPNYLSDMLRSYTGKGTQQHIHDKLIEKAKDALITTTLSVSEIAYTLGFEHPQSFSRLFKTRTNQTPLKFRSSFN